MTEAVKPRRPYNASRRTAQARATRQRIGEAARRLFVANGYAAVTIADIAAEAGVAYQTVYAVFGNKQRLAHEIIWTTFEVTALDEQLAQLTESAEPEEWLRSAARIARVVSERLGTLLRVLQESGEPELLAEPRAVDERRRSQEHQLAHRLASSGRLRDDLSESEALDVLWTMTGTSSYQQLVVERGWTADRYEAWLADSLVRMLLEATP